MSGPYAPAQVPALNGAASFLKFPQHFKQILVIGLIGNVVNVDKGELALLIDDEKRALGDAIAGTIGTIRFGYFAFRTKVAEKIVGKSAETLGPGGIAGNAVN